MALELGYIKRNNLEQNPQLTKKFEFKKAPCVRRISNRGDRVYCKKMFVCAFDYEEVFNNAQRMKENPGIVLVGEPFLLDDELQKKCVRWVEWANAVSPEEYDPFVRIEVKQ